MSGRLREQLTALASLRAPARDARARPLPPDAGHDEIGFSVREQCVPLTARAVLATLAEADTQAARLLVRDCPPQVPPVSDWLFLDLETTGLAGGTGTYAFLIGVAQLEPGGLHVRQFFLRELGEERTMLDAFLPQLQQASALTTYNGKLFDAPLLETRLRLARRRSRLERLPHFDLLYPARRFWRERWGSARLTELERCVLGHARADDVPGEEIPRRYFDFLRRGDGEPLEAVFRHNADDLVSVAALAARLLQLAGSPESAAREPMELAAAAGLYERGGEHDRARSLYESVLREPLPEEAAQGARRRLALLAKRGRDFERAAALWSELLAQGNGSADRAWFEACEELAICYEHRLEDPEAALEVTRRALARQEWMVAKDAAGRAARERFAHRARRLERKLAQRADESVASGLLSACSSPAGAP